MHNNHSNKELRVVFPFSVLRKESTLLDPDNTQFVQQYYLLENLAAGLVRDDPQDPKTYRPVLALKWESLNDQTWVFQIRPDLKWSDGSLITGQQIVDHFKRLKKSKARHIIYLKNIKNLQYDDSQNKLFLTFSKHVGSSLLHELSLADAALLHPTNLNKNWGVTSGTYSVIHYDPNKSILQLKLNKHSPLATPESPVEVFLFDVPLEERKKLFREIDADLVRLPLLSHRRSVQTVTENAPKLVRGFPNELYYFAFNPKHSLSHNKEARMEFASLVQESWGSQRIHEHLQPETQFIPAGFDGRLPTYVPVRHPIRILKDNPIKINFHPAFREMEGLLSNFKNSAAKHGVGFSFNFTAYTEGEETSTDDFVRFRTFKGNQRDPLGSWLFLFSGALEPYKKDVEGYFKKIVASQSDEERGLLLQKLHLVVLEEVYGIPFWIEATGYAASDLIDLSKWNPFDMRMRLYDVRWKQ